MTCGAGIEDQTGRAERTGNVERQRLLNSPPNSGGALEITPFEQFEPRFTHAASTSLHDHLTSRAYTITRVLARGTHNILFFCVRRVVLGRYCPGTRDYTLAHDVATG
jgi:hypothetical protein